MHRSTSTATRDAPDCGFGSSIRPLLANPAKLTSGKICGRISRFQHSGSARQLVLDCHHLTDVAQSQWHYMTTKCPLTGWPESRRNKFPEFSRLFQIHKNYFFIAHRNKK